MSLLKNRVMHLGALLVLYLGTLFYTRRGGCRSCCGPRMFGGDVTNRFIETAEFLVRVSSLLQCSRGRTQIDERVVLKKYVRYMQ